MTQFQNSTFEKNYSNKLNLQTGNLILLTSSSIEYQNKIIWVKSKKDYVDDCVLEITSNY